MTVKEFNQLKELTKKEFLAQTQESSCYITKEVMK